MYVYLWQVKHALRRSAIFIIRWTARIASALFILLVILSFLGEGETARSRPLYFFDYVMLAILATEVVGFAFAWKWELLGGVVVVAAYVVGALLNPLTVKFPMTLIPVVGCMFILCWTMARFRRKQQEVLEGDSQM